MSINVEKYNQLISDLKGIITVVAVSKIQPISKIKGLYDMGHRDFGENYVQEIVEKYELLPKDINWHFIGHLQTNKVKYIAPFISLIQSVDSLKLLKEINKQGKKNNRTINCLLQIYIAKEETKFGLSEEELDDILNNDVLKDLKNIKITGLMGMASFVEDENKIREEFKSLKSLLNKYLKQLTLNHEPLTLSMGMSSDYKMAIEEGSNMVRIGSLLFGNRN